MRKLADKGEPIAARGVFARCGYCGAEYSASAGDYFSMDDDAVLKCNGAGSHPGREMDLAYSERIFHNIPDA